VTVANDPKAEQRTAAAVAAFVDALRSVPSVQTIGVAHGGPTLRLLVEVTGDWDDGVARIAPRVAGLRSKWAFDYSVVDRASARRLMPQYRIEYSR
jgi:hypothetical protein